MTDSAESRIGRLEREHARLEARVESIATQVGELIPLQTGLVRLEGVVNGVKDDVHAIGGQIADVRGALADRDKQQTEERRSLRLALLSLAGTIIAAIIAAVITIAASGAHP